MSSIPVDDPYAPRSTQQYYNQPAQDGNSSASSSSSSRSSSSSSTTSASTSTSSTSSSSTPRTRPRPTVTEQEREEEEPLFGGRPFRDSHSAPTDQQPDDPTPSSSSNHQQGQDPNSFPSPESQDKDGLYAILNVERDASDEKIKEAYRALAVILHPDKHPSPSLKASAESRFREVQRAYEILTDREKRAVYDYFGESGLKSTWSVGLRGKSPSEMRAEFERQRNTKITEDVEKLLKSKAELTTSLDFIALFAPASRFQRGPKIDDVGLNKDNVRGPNLFDRWNRCGVSSLVGKASNEVGITDRTSMNFAAQMVSRNGMGGGNLVGTVKHQWSPRLFTEATMTLMRPRIFNVKGQYTWDENTFLTFLSTSHTPFIPPSLSLTLGQRISSSSMTTGFTSFKTGNYSLGPWGSSILSNPNSMVRREPPSISAGITSQSGDGKGWTSQIGLSEVDQSLSMDWGTKVLGGVKLRFGFILGTGSGLSCFTNSERRLTETVKLGLGLNFGLPGPVSLRIRINRLGQKLIVPITLSNQFRQDLIVACTLIPSLSFLTLHHLYLVPRKRKGISNRLERLRKENKEMIRERRKGAKEARMLLLDQAKKKFEVEIKRKGLVVVEACYGKRELFGPRPQEGTDLNQLAKDVWREEFEKAERDQRIEEENGDVNQEERVRDYDEIVVKNDENEEKQIWDVKIPLMALINNGQLIIPGGRPKSNLLAFHDPCMGEKKHLLIRYVFRDSLHELIVDDVGAVAAPLRAHQL